MEASLVSGSGQAGQWRLHRDPSARPDAASATVILSVRNSQGPRYILHIGAARLHTTIGCVFPVSARVAFVYARENCASGVASSPLGSAMPRSLNYVEG